jgi:hypothetical protein
VALWLAAGGVVGLMALHDFHGKVMGEIREFGEGVDV